MNSRFSDWSYPVKDVRIIYTKAGVVLHILLLLFVKYSIDKTAPVVGNLTNTTNSVTINATDDLSGIIGVKLTTTNTVPTTFDAITNTKTLTNKVIGNLTQNTTYYVWVKDGAGNVSASKAVTTLKQAVTSVTVSPTTKEIKP